MLLTHTSGEGIDVSLEDPWGLDGADKAEGIHRALTTPLQSGPGEVFRYSDINYILLGALIEKTHRRGRRRLRSAECLCAAWHGRHPLPSSQPKHVAHTRSEELRLHGLPRRQGASRSHVPQVPGAPVCCRASHQRRSTTKADADPGKNPDFGYLLRGTVHDPTARRMGGVAGHAGVFSTAHDVSIFAQALLDRLAGRPSKFPLKQATLELMTTPEQPGHTAGQLEAANDAAREAIARHQTTSAARSALSGDQRDRTCAASAGTSIRHYSKPRGMIFPIGSFGHTGFTGTSLWMDPGSDTYVILLANVNPSARQSTDLGAAR